MSTKKTKMFHLGDVLSVTTHRLVSPRGMRGVYDILDFMTGMDVFTIQVPSAMDLCKPRLLLQHPRLGSAGMRRAVDDLSRMLETARARERKALVARWLAKVIAGKYRVKLNERLEVRALR